METTPDPRPEARLARLVAATPATSGTREAGPWRLDLIHLSGPDQERLEACLH